MWQRHRSAAWLCGWGPLILSHHPAKFGVHRAYGTGNGGVCNIISKSSSNFNSNSNAEVYKWPAESVLLAGVCLYSEAEWLLSRKSNLKVFMLQVKQELEVNMFTLWIGKKLEAKIILCYMCLSIWKQICQIW